MPKIASTKKHAIAAPARIWLRLVQQVPPGTPGAFQDQLFGYWWTTSASRGLNGTGGFQQVEHNPILNDSSEMTVSLPPVGSDGRNITDRLYYFASTPNPQIASYATMSLAGGTVGYMPGDEWIELRRGASDLVQIATPVSETTGLDQIQIVCRDVTAISKKTRETAGGFWNHAPRDVFEHYTRAIQTAIAEDFVNPPVFSVLNSATPQTTTDARWVYVGVSSVQSSLLALTVPSGLGYAQIAQSTQMPGVADLGPSDHSCWRAECSIIGTSIAGAGATATITFGISPENTTIPSTGTYALTIGPAAGSVLAKTVNYRSGAYYYDSWPVNSAGLLDSSNQLAPPYTMAIEARERWVFMYLDGQLISVVPRVALDPHGVGLEACPFVYLNANAGDSITVDYIVMRNTTPPMNGGQSGDYVLASSPSPGGLQGAYYDTTLAYGPNGLVGAHQLTQYGATPPTFTPGSVRVDSGVYWPATVGPTIPAPTGVYIASTQPQPTGLNEGTTYYYEVTAVNASGETTASTQLTYAGPGLTVAPTGSGVSFAGSLPAPAGFWGRVYSSRSGGWNSINYYWIVTALNAAGETTQSSTFVQNMSGANYDRVWLYWNAVPGATSYNVYTTYQGGPTNGGFLGNTTSLGMWDYFGADWPGSSVDFGHTAPAVNTTGSGALTGTYYWKVTAVNGSGETTASAELSGNTGANSNQIATLTWNAVPGAASYNIYRSTTSGSEGLVGNTTATTFSDDGTVAPGAHPPTTNTAQKYAATVSWNAVTNASSYNVYRSTSSGTEKFLANVTNNQYQDVGNATGAASPPSTNTATQPSAATPGWFPAALGNAQSAYVRWTGSIYLPLGAGQPVTFKLPGTAASSQALWVGCTRQSEAICMNDSGYLASFLGAGHVDYPAETARTTSVDLRTILGHKSGWYPVVFEYIWRLTDPSSGEITGFTYNTGSGYVVPTPYVLSPYGCFTGQIAANDSYFDVLQATIGQSFAINWITTPAPLESPNFPGTIVPLVRVGRDIDLDLSEANSDNPQETSTAEDNATTDVAQAQGLGGGNSGSLTAEAFNYAAMAAHPFTLTESENLPATTQLALLVLQMETLLALRSNVFQQLHSDTTSDRSMQDSWPLTGALAEFDWSPGDGLRVVMPQIGVVDQTPRQIQSLKRIFYQDGMGQNTASFRPRPRDFIHTMRRFIRQVYSGRRVFQGQLTYVPGTQAVAPALVSAALPADTTLVRQATLTVLSKSDQTTPFGINVNGQATGLQVLGPGVVDISNYIARNNAVEPQMIASLTNSGASNCQVSYMISLLVLVPSI